jgi:predicted nucleic acid-binding protein
MTDDTAFAVGCKVYIDANMFIYQFERMDELSSRVTARLTEIGNQGGSLVTSELTVAECCYKPAGDGNATLLSVYEDFFEKSGEVELFALSGSIVKRAALTGGSLGLKLLDAIHYVTAVDANCTHFLTGDRAFKSGSGLRVVVV